MKPIASSLRSASKKGRDSKKIENHRPMEKNNNNKNVNCLKFKIISREVVVCWIIK